MFLSFHFIQDQRLERFGLCWSSQLPVADFLPINQPVGPLAAWRTRQTLMLPCMSFLTGVNATEPRTSSLTRQGMAAVKTLSSSRTKQGGERLSGLEEVRGCDCIVVRGIDGYIDKGLLQSVEPGSTGRICRRLGIHGFGLSFERCCKCKVHVS